MKYSLCITSPEITKHFVFSMMKGTFEEKLENMHLLGYDAIELLPGYPKECDSGYVKRICDSKSLNISDVSSGALTTVTGLSLLSNNKDERREGESLFFSMIDLAASLNVSIVTIGAFRGWVKDVGGLENGYEIICDILFHVRGKLEDNNITVALEPVNRNQTDIFNTCREALSFIERCNLKNIGILYDTYNAYESECDYISALRDVLESGRLIHFHIADSFRLPPGEGKVDFVSLLKILDEYGYKGYLSGELKSDSDPNDVGRKIIDVMREYEKCI